MSVRLALASIAIVIAGCDRPPPSAVTLPAPTFGSATITGQIRFVGDPPERKMIDTSTCQDGARAYQEETIVVGAAGGLRDVIVYLKDAPASDGASRGQITLDQIGCRYSPHVLAVQIGQRLKIRTSDSVPHNTRWSSEVSGDVNFGLLRAGESKDVHFAAPEMLSLHCDVHPWMTSAVGVMNSPFFAVTADDGRFDIPRVPAGHYTLAAWHPILGERTRAIDVASDGTVEASIDFAPPANALH